jgi:hypothetical protein
MLKKLFAAAALLLSVQAHATVISVDLDQMQYKVGDTIKANLVVSDIQTLISGFEATLTFNQDLVQLTDVAFGNFLTLPGFFLDNTQDSELNAGQVKLSEVFLGFTLEDLLDLGSLQPNDTFVLATVSFKALTHGVSNFGLTELSVLYSPFDGPDYQDIEAMGKAASAKLISAPATFALLLPALLWLRRRQH